MFATSNKYSLASDFFKENLLQLSCKLVLLSMVIPDNFSASIWLGVIRVLPLNRSGLPGFGSTTTGMALPCSSFIFCYLCQQTLSSNLSQ